MYEKIVHNRLYNYMTINSLMNKNQYGFRKLRSLHNKCSFQIHLW